MKSTNEQDVAMIT